MVSEPDANDKQTGLTRDGRTDLLLTTAHQHCMLASLATRICSRQPQSTIMKDSMSCIRFGFTRICLFLWLFVSFMLACLVESFSMHPLSSFTPSCSTIAPATRQLYMASSSSSSFDHDYLELAWRYAKKPLLRIGSKGATLTHGNSLRQLLEAHTVVKVKINTRKYGNYTQREI